MSDHQTTVQAGVTRHPAAPFVLPFAVFVFFLAVLPALGLPERTDLLLRVVALSTVILVFSRRLLSFSFTSPGLSILVGVAVFGIWVAPDILFPHYRDHPVFQNALTGTLKSSLSPETLSDPISLVLRSFRAIALVPILEELFWRGWLMRWIINPKFQTVAPGTYQRNSFWLVAILFALEHGPYWDVGFVAGAIYNGWMVRTKNWNDCILAHAVTNACLCLFIVVKGQWQYWL
jgi:uncharacterized protein